jgi:heme/copper-type cytochrome/quinol oxidase subunit 2
VSVLYFFITLLGVAIAIILTYKTFQYTYTMWKFKNRKKDGSEDKEFKYFD